MKRRSLCLLLIVLMLASHGLPLVHAHAGAGDEQAFRPHVHVGGQGNHAGHSHGHNTVWSAPSGDDEVSEALGLEPLADHDSNAVYCAEQVTLAQSTRVATVATEKCVVASSILKVLHEGGIASACLNSSHGPPAVAHSADLPIYLRTLSLRI